MATRTCPCGYLGSTQKTCRCTPDQIARFQSKLSGPLLDRIDLHIEVGALPSAELLQAPSGESSAVARQGGSNSALQGKAIDQAVLLDEAAAKFLNVAAARLGWSGRSTHRAIKVARTIADLAGAHSTQVAHVAEVMQYRQALSGAS
jgi:magnesium chelatase family protein